MDIFNVLSLIGGIALFLFGMNTMSAALQRAAGSKLKNMLSKLTSSAVKGLLLGAGVTAVIQSSSATTVMVVGFVNSGLMTLRQAVGVIMGANVGTTITSWILSLAGIDGGSIFLQLIKPSGFVPILSAIGVVLLLFAKTDKKKNIGTTLLGFSVLMFGMETMSAAVKPLAEMPAFVNLFTLFSNPIIGVLIGMLVTAAVQSSSASVGILQALSATGSVTIASAIPIIMGQNIGTCITALISSAGTSKGAKRAAMVHLYFNLIGTVVCMGAFYALNAIIGFEFMGAPADYLSIAIIHTAFNVITTSVLLPFASKLEKLAVSTVREGRNNYAGTLLDERLLATPAIAVEQGRNVTSVMAEMVKECFTRAEKLLNSYSDTVMKTVEEMEQESDRYEDELNKFLVSLGECNLSDDDTADVFCLLRSSTDLERIADHALNLAESAKELSDKGLSFSEEGKRDVAVLVNAVAEVADLALTSFSKNLPLMAREVEPLEQVVDGLALEVRNSHIKRLSKGKCGAEQGFILNDIVMNLERISDHCSNIALYVIERTSDNFEPHAYSAELLSGRDEEFNRMYRYYKGKYSLIQDSNCDKIIEE